MSKEHAFHKFHCFSYSVGNGFFLATRQKLTGLILRVANDVPYLSGSFVNRADRPRLGCVDGVVVHHLQASPDVPQQRFEIICDVRYTSLETVGRGLKIPRSLAENVRVKPKDVEGTKPEPRLCHPPASKVVPMSWWRADLYPIISFLYSLFLESHGPVLSAPNCTQMTESAGCLNMPGDSFGREIGCVRIFPPRLLPISIWPARATIVLLPRIGTRNVTASLKTDLFAARPQFQAGWLPLATSCNRSQTFHTC